MFNSPHGIVADDIGNAFVTDSSNHLIRQIDIFGTVTTLAGMRALGLCLCLDKLQGNSLWCN